jgi:pantoate--beta-alanine ligase
VRIFTTVSALQRVVDNEISAQKIVGLVPTMGALHNGHLSLVKLALSQCDFVVMSIFVNPTQFNESQDFVSYPRSPKDDIAFLENSGCHAVFLPDYNTVYPKPDETVYDFGELELLFEGKFRPGHFKGVAMVVRRLFELVKPHKAYFGLKDFQQVMVVKAMVKQFNLPVEIIGAPTVRENDGLAMSSRNRLLNPSQRIKALLISEVLTGIQQRIKNEDISDALNWGVNRFKEDEDFELEYLSIANAENLEPINSKNAASHAVALVAARLGNVRLIDNLQLY